MATKRTEDVLTKVSETSFMNQNGQIDTTQVLENKAGETVVLRFIDGVEQQPEPGTNGEA
jgi:ABC-type Na+ transport system ATPase subunit NatA